jgi:DNA (cytosine-5)-methyltransferase 1
MTAYYNDIDKSACAWLRELIKQGLIADGVVDERSITDVQASDLKGFTQIHLFAGIGGFSKALRGYGNSIVPSVGAEFIKAFMAVQNEQ